MELLNCNPNYEVTDKIKSIEIEKTKNFDNLYRKLNNFSAELERRQDILSYNYHAVKISHISNAVFESSNCEFE